MTTRTQERESTYSQALEKFARWLAAHRQPDGSLQLTSRACVAYVALPVYAHAVGDTEWLERSLRIIEERCLEDADTFLHPPSKNLIPYRAAWMLLGAVLGQQFTLARWLETWILRFWHRDTGGFFGTEAARQAGHGTICFDSTAQACAALCVAGNIVEAERLGEFLKRLVQAQPDPQRRFLCVWDTERGAAGGVRPEGSAQLRHRVGKDSPVPL